MTYSSNSALISSAYTGSVTIWLRKTSARLVCTWKSGNVKSDSFYMYLEMISYCLFISLWNNNNTSEDLLDDSLRSAT